MIRQKVIDNRYFVEPGFLWRGGDVSRLEGLSDNVFGFAITLLVVSLEVPHTFEDLMLTVYGFVPFAVCFTFLAMVWHEHYIYFRRYGLEDGKCVVLNLLLLFVVLFYIYPLKFLFTNLLTNWFGSEAASRAAGNVFNGHARAIMSLYGIGFLAVYLVFWLLYRHAWNQREALELSELERFDTRSELISHMLSMSVAVLSLILVVVLPDHWVALSGMIYMLMGPVHGFRGAMRGKMRRKLEERSPAMATP